tara:strand:+ start:2811 stop:3746 length:936 start_codon:yes stop_codon:yes gene_type:complete
MKIVIIGPGMMEIPPIGWGAVEILIWDYKETLESLGHDVYIINTRSHADIVNKTNELEPDFVHIQYDEYAILSEHIKCKNIAATSHYGYLDQPNKYGGYKNIHNSFLRTKSKVFALSPSIKDKYIEGGMDEKKVFVVPNGVRNDLFTFKENCERPNDSIYLAKVDHRKRQHLFHDIPDLYFAGNIADHRYNKNNYLGEWSKDYLYKNLTNFANLVLLSDGEAHPLVCLEAMSAGLGLVISEWATANLDTSLPFIDVITEDRINDVYHVEKIIKENKNKCLNMRKDIRQYALDNFSWKHIINSYYLPSIKSL